MNQMSLRGVYFTAQVNNNNNDSNNNNNNNNNSFPYDNDNNI